MVKLADALDSKSSGSDTVPVRLRPAAPSKRASNTSCLLFLRYYRNESNLSVRFPSGRRQPFCRLCKSTFPLEGESPASGTIKKSKQHKLFALFALLYLPKERLLIVLLSRLEKSTKNA